MPTSPLARIPIALLLCTTLAAQPEKPTPASGRRVTSKPADPSRPVAPPAKLELVIAGCMAPILKPGQGKTRFPAVVVGVLHGGDRYVKAFGDTGTKQAPDRVLFGVASATKPITALLLAKMVAGGDVKLDDPAVSREDHPNLCPDGKPILWRHLAMHTSGLPVVPDDLQAVGKRAYTDAKFDAYLGRLKLRGAPGARYEYSTTGYTLLGRLLAQKKSGSFDEVLRREVLVPLGMNSSFLVLGAEERKLLAVGHRDGKALEAYTKPTVFAPSGGLYTSVGDLLIFLHANVQPTKAWREPMALLQEASDVRSVPGSVMALGWQLFKPASFYWHAGHAAGYHSFMAFHPKTKSGVVVLTNAGTSPADTRLAMASFGLLGQVMQGGFND